MLKTKRRRYPILFKGPLDEHVEKLEGRDEDKRCACFQKARAPIANDNVGASMHKELSFRFVYWVYHCVRPRWKQFLLDKCVYSFEEPNFVFSAFCESA
ncbi:hypothetical protein D3C78_1632740 [compost metagenome]